MAEQHGKLRGRSMWGRDRRQLIAAALASVACAAFLIRGPGSGQTQQQQPQPPPPPPPEEGSGEAAAAGDGGWSGSFLFKKADPELTQLMDQASWVSPMRQCPAHEFSFDRVSAGAAERLILPSKSDYATRAGEVDLVEGIAHNLPCRRKEEGGACCDRRVVMRAGTTDYQVFKQVFQCHYMRYLYTLFGHEGPKHILDAGANVGFATVLFKLIWPAATVVSLEPDPTNFKVLKKNVKSLKGVHPKNVGLWGHRANITVTGDHGNWGKVFREAKPGEQGMPAYSVQDLAAEMGIPAFDFVKVDIEGAEGMVFAPGGNFSWIQQARAVSLEVHDFFAKYFGLEEVSSRVDAAFQDSGYTIVSDNEHIMYLSPELREQLSALQLPSEAELEAVNKGLQSVC